MGKHIIKQYVSNDDPNTTNRGIQIYFSGYLEKMLLNLSFLVLFYSLDGLFKGKAGMLFSGLYLKWKSEETFSTTRHHDAFLEGKVICALLKRGLELESTQTPQSILPPTNSDHVTSNVSHFIAESGVYHLLSWVFCADKLG